MTTYAATTFYQTYALLMAARYYINDLVNHKDVSFNLKRDLRLLCNRITDLERISKQSLNATDAAAWSREWTEKDYLVFANVLGKMCDMTEEQRAGVEEFVIQLEAGNIKMQLDETI